MICITHNELKSIKSTSNQFKRNVHRHLITVLKYYLQIHLEVDTTPEIFHRRTRIVTRQNHVKRNLHITSHVTITNLDQLDLSLLVQSLASLHRLHTQHLKIDRSDWRVRQVDNNHPVKIVIKEYDLALKLTSYLKDRHFTLISFDISSDHHKILFLGVDKIVNSLSTSFGHLQIKRHLVLNFSRTRYFDMNFNRIADADIHSNICLEIFVVSLIQLKFKWNLGILRSMWRTLYSVFDLASTSSGILMIVMGGTFLANYSVSGLLCLPCALTPPQTLITILSTLILNYCYIA